MPLLKTLQFLALKQKDAVIVWFIVRYIVIDTYRYKDKYKQLLHSEVPLKAEAPVLAIP